MRLNFRTDFRPFRVCAKCSRIQKWLKMVRGQIRPILSYFLINNEGPKNREFLIYNSDQKSRNCLFSARFLKCFFSWTKRLIEFWPRQSASSSRRNFKSWPWLVINFSIKIELCFSFYKRNSSFLSRISLRPEYSSVHFNIFRFWRVWQTWISYDFNRNKIKSYELYGTVLLWWVFEQKPSDGFFKRKNFVWGWYLSTVSWKASDQKRNWKIQS